MALVFLEGYGAITGGGVAIEDVPVRNAPPDTAGSEQSPISASAFEMGPVCDFL